jgi:hypothetical protein
MLMEAEREFLTRAIVYLYSGGPTADLFKALVQNHTVPSGYILGNSKVTEEDILEAHIACRKLWKTVWEEREARFPEIKGK